MTAGSAPGRAADPARTIFFGSGAFAVPILDAVADAPRIDLVAVVTTPDRPAGRSRTLTPTPVAVRARALGLPLLQPAGVRSPAVLAELEALKPDLGVLADYGRIIPPALLELPRHGIVGVHPSLLPRHRGATPIQATILEGDTEAGISIYRMDPGLDTGPVLAARSWPLEGTETAPDLEREAAARGATLLAETLPGYLDGTLLPMPQAGTGASLTTRLTREDARLDPARPAAELERQVRAFMGWPGSFIETDAGRVAILAASLAEDGSSDRLGTIVEVHGGRPALVAGDGTRLVLERVRPAGGREMSGTEWLRGHRELLGTIVAGAGTVDAR